MDRIEAPLALIERLDRDGHVLQSTLVYRWPMKIGRSFEADLVLDDPHMAPLHIELDVLDDGVLQLRVGQTINGALVGARHVSGGESMALAPAQVLRVGATRLRVRLASEPMAPERPLAHHLSTQAPAAQMVPSWAQVMPWLLLSLLGLLFEQWLDNNPGTAANTYLSAVLITLAVTMGWSLFWSLGNKLFQGRLDFKAHLRLALVYGLGWSALSAALPLVAYAMDWPVLSRIATVASTGVLCALIWAHLAWIMPAHQRGLMMGVATLYLGGVGMHLWFNEERTGQLFTERYAAALPPPSWRMAATQSPTALMADAKAMKARLDEQAKDDSRDDTADASADD